MKIMVNSGYSNMESPLRTENIVIDLDRFDISIPSPTFPYGTVRDRYGKYHMINNLDESYMIKRKFYDYRSSHGRMDNIYSYFRMSRRDDYSLQEAYNSSIKPEVFTNKTIKEKKTNKTLLLI
jgi:hypothetical protein